MSDSLPVPGPPPPALIAEATKRAGLIWIKVPGAGRPRAAWHVWRQDGGRGAAYLLTGPGEQQLPGLAGASRVTVLVPSKDSGGLLTAWEAGVAEVGPGSPEWDAVIGSLVAGRLNARRPPGREAAVYRLTPAALPAAGKRPPADEHRRLVPYPSPGGKGQPPAAAGESARGGGDRGGGAAFPYPPRYGVSDGVGVTGSPPGVSGGAAFRSQPPAIVPGGIAT